ncbi:MAG: ATP-binding protein [Nocardioides sp.]
MTVTDNGIGLLPGEQERIFQEFHRAHGTQYDGTGLGLAIVRRIVIRHGGTITARNRDDGSGSIFELTLPTYG